MFCRLTDVCNYVVSDCTALQLDFAHSKGVEIVYTPEQLVVVA